MRHYSNFIFLLVQLLLVQSDDRDSNYFYQKLLTTTNRSKSLPISSFLTNDRPSVLYPHTFYESYYSKTETTTPITAIHIPRSFDYRRHDDIMKTMKWYYSAQFQCLSKSSKCGESPNGWCCPEGKRCGNTYGVCFGSYSRVRENFYIGEGIIIVGILICVCITMVCILIGICVCITNVCMVTGPSNNLVVSNSSTLELSRRPTEPTSLPINLVPPQFRANHNLPRQGIQSLIRDIAPRNTIASIEQDLSEYDNGTIRRATITAAEQQTSSSLPSYDDVVRQSSITITMEQQSLLPPSYNDFIRKNNDSLCRHING